MSEGMKCSETKELKLETPECYTKEYLVKMQLETLMYINEDNAGYETDMLI